MRIDFKSIVLSVGALLLASCAQEPFDNPFYSGEITISARHEDRQSETKTALVDGDVFWSAGEHISIFYGSGTNGGSDFVSTNTQPAKLADFTGNIGTTAGAQTQMFWGIYPYDTQNSCDGSSVTTVIPAVQTAVPNTFADNQFVSIGRASSLSMSFYNLLSGLKMTFSKRTDITELRIRSLNAQDKLAGKVHVVMDDEGHPVIDNVIAGESEVVLTCPEGQTFQKGPFYYALLRPQTFSQGIVIDFYAGDVFIGSRTFARSLNFYRNLFKRGDDIDSDIVLAVTGVELNKTALSLSVDQTEQLTATVLPADVANKAVTWTSSNPVVAAVSEDGLVTAVAAGSATITVTTVEGNRTASCVVTVTETDDLATPLCLEAIESGTISISNPRGLTIEYKKNAADWVSASDATIEVSVADGDRVYFRGNNASYATGDEVYTNIASTGNVYVYGNVMSLINAQSFETLTKLTGNLALAGLFRDNAKIQNHPERQILLPATTLSSQCYRYMFKGCSGLTFAPVLPAMKVTSCGYKYMFWGCTGLKTPPELPATEVLSNGYFGMFQGCTELLSAPDLPATQLGAECYYQMFLGCTKLKSAPASLPATTLASKCYMGMFQGCTSLVTAPALPATTLAVSCYQRMFSGCTALKNAPSLPATSLANSCYENMFTSCTALVNAPVLSAASLAERCYLAMFQNCSSLTSAPALPATTLASQCYRDMFNGCAKLATAPILPATTLVFECYRGMFYNCINLALAPDLLAESLAEGCYQGMFNGCSKLNYIKMLAIDISATNAMTSWTSNVASTGTFVKNYDATWNVVGVNGIPTGWVVERVMTRDPILVSGISLDKSSLSLTIGGNYTISATVSPSNADEKGLSWASSNSSVATVDQTGKVTAIAVGNATITASAIDESGKSASCTVTVNPVAVTSVTLNESSLSFSSLNATQQLIATVAPDNATYNTVTWSSSDTNVVTVSSNGTVTSVGSGTAIITATADGKYATCDVTVFIPVTGVSLNKQATSITIGSSETLQMTLTPADATNKNVTWTTSDADIASVDANGKVTAVAVGTATITVKTQDGNKTATCRVTVNPIAVTGVTLNTSSLNFSSLNATRQLTATVSPTNATYKTVNWSSSNPSVATVASSGTFTATVTAKSSGTATITVTTIDGGFTATCSVKVSIPVTGISLNKSSATLTVGDNLTLVPTITPTNASNKDVVWSSSNNVVATVSESGVVNALAVGSAVITATTVDGGKVARCTITVNPQESDREGYGTANNNGSWGN